MSVSKVMTGQGVLLTRPAVERLNAADGIVHTADLEWPLFDPEQEMTMAEYVGEIGLTMAEYPREDSVTDSALQLFRNDFKQAEPVSLMKGLVFPFSDPTKSVVKVNKWRKRLDRQDYPGELPFTTGVAVSEDVYEEIVKSAPHFANQVDNKTQRANLNNSIVEARADLAGESAVYALTDKHEVLEARDRTLLNDRSFLLAVNRSVITPNHERRIRNLETYRLRSLVAIQEMVRIACKGLEYGTNQTHNTLNAVASNTHRSSEPDRWWAAYTAMAIYYIDEVRGKIGQSIHSCVDQIGANREHLINNIDREYQD